jgi:hypothetical protein
VSAKRSFASNISNVKRRGAVDADIVLHGTVVLLAEVLRPKNENFVNDERIKLRIKK